MPADTDVTSQRARDIQGRTLEPPAGVNSFNTHTNPLAVPRGGCPSLEGESDAKIAARLLLLPVWHHPSHGAAL